MAECAEGVTSVAAWAGVETEQSSKKGDQVPSSVEAAAAWMAALSSLGTNAQAAGRYLNQQSGFVAATHRCLRVSESVARNAQRFPVGTQLRFLFVRRSARREETFLKDTMCTIK